MLKPIPSQEPTLITEPENPTQESLKLSFPIWPIQNTVAVNPFWFLRQKTFDHVAKRVSLITGESLLMPLEYYQEKLQEGEISNQSLSTALQDARKIWPDLPSSIEDFTTLLRQQGPEPFSKVKTFAEYYDIESGWSSRIVCEVGKYAAAYLDEHQSLSKFPWKNRSFWKAWMESQSFDKTMESYGIKEFRGIIKNLENLEAEDSISRMLNDIGLSTPRIRQAYLEALLTSVLGWSTQFTYLSWQRQLGYSEKSLGTTSDLLVVRLAYDYALIQISQNNDPTTAKKWLDELHQKVTNQETSPIDIHFQLKYVYQLAWELSYQEKLAVLLKNRVQVHRSSPIVKMVFCIDVRSEMIRRHIETESPEIQTIGFAGFFGFPIDYIRPDQSHFDHRLPVLLKPAIQVLEESKKSNKKDKQVDHLASSYFRNLRKGNLSSFAYVEFFGALYIEKLIHKSWPYLRSFLKKNNLPDRFSDVSTRPSLDQTFSIDGMLADQHDLINRAATVLRHMGLTSNFSELVVIVGHGSETTNNALGSSLDCGACGGHSGDINARFFVNFLNSPTVRTQLREKSIEIPESTWFIAAIHETVSDQIFLLDQDQIPENFHNSYRQLEETLKRVSIITQKERQHARSLRVTAPPKRRSKNWAEIRPEWGLAGNASFIIAPRDRTMGLNLNSRSFLHDYSWSEDQKSGYQTLELIMTAPMVVTNWINLQYYASTVAPNLYGAGNKILHNLINETGVIEGNGGDLRMGLAFQSLHDGHKYIHDPLRLSVWIEAPQEPIESMIQKHEVVRSLVENEWLHILQINPADQRILRRLRNGTYVEI